VAAEDQRDDLRIVLIAIDQSLMVAQAIMAEYVADRPSCRRQVAEIEVRRRQRGVSHQGDLFVTGGLGQGEILSC